MVATVTIMHPDELVTWRDPDGEGGTVHCLPILGVHAR
jgi:hypothetical protein